MIVWKQRGARVFVALALALAGAGAAVLVPQRSGVACTTVGTGVSGSTPGAYSFSPLHLGATGSISPGMLLDQNGCQVVLNGFNLAGIGYGDAKDGSGSQAHFDTNILSFFKTNFPTMNAWRVAINAHWYTADYPLTTTSWMPALGITDYRSWVNYLITDTAKYGAYIDLTSNSMFPDSWNDAHDAEAQGNADFTNGGTANAAWAFNPMICADGGLITDTLPMWSSISATFPNDPHIIYNVWGEFKSQCGRSPGTDPDQSTALAPGHGWSYNAYAGGSGGGDAASTYTGVVYPDSRTYSVWKNHQDAMIRAVRANSPSALVVLSAQDFGHNFCPLTGDVGNPGSCSNQVTAPPIPDFTEPNLLWDVHTYPGACFDGGACGGATGDFMSQKANYPADANWEFLRAGATSAVTATNPMATPHNVLYGETTGSQDTTNANDYPCNIYPEVKAKHGAGVLDFEAANMFTAGGYPNSSVTVGNLNTLAKSDQNNFGYLLGQNPHVLEEDDTTICPGT